MYFMGFLKGIDFETISWQLAGLSIAVVIFTKFYVYLRPQFDATVTCWFCHVKAKVPYNDRNSWDCKCCDQYNGFLTDGGYNKIIPAQYDANLNSRPTSRQSTTSLPASNGLCEACNNNQRLKVLQLAAFRPRDPAQFDHEVEVFQCDLDRAYQLCGRCEVELKSRLSKEKAWLLGLKLSQLRDVLRFKESPSSNRCSRLAALLLASSLLSSCVLLLASLPSLLPTLQLVIPPTQLNLVASTLEQLASLVREQRTMWAMAGAGLQIVALVLKRNAVGVACVVAYLACCVTEFYATTYVQACSSAMLLILCVAAAFASSSKTKSKTTVKIAPMRSVQPPATAAQPANIFQEALQSQKLAQKLSDTPQAEFEPSLFTSRHNLTQAHFKPSFFTPQVTVAQAQTKSSLFVPQLNTSRTQKPSLFAPHLNIDKPVSERTSPVSYSRSSPISFTRSRRPVNDISHLLNDSSRNLSLPLNYEDDYDSMERPRSHSTPESNSSREQEDIDRGIGNLNIGSLSARKPASDFCHLRRRPLVAPARLPTPPWHLGEQSVFLPVSRSSSQSSGFASQCSRTPAGSVCGEEPGPGFRSEENPFNKSCQNQAPSLSGYIRRPQDSLDSSYHTSLLPRNPTLFPGFFPGSSFNATVVGNQIVLTHSPESVYRVGFNYNPPMYPLYSPPPSPPAQPPAQERELLMKSLICFLVVVNLVLFVWKSGWDVADFARRAIEWF